MQKSQRAKRMERRHNRAKRAGHLNLVSIVDIFTVLVFFLLVNSSDVATLPSTNDVELPESIAEEAPGMHVVVLVDEERILVQGEQVATIAEALATPGSEIPALREALLAQNERELGAGEDDIAGREVTIMGDKDIPYRLLKKVMATCTAADYGQISLAVLQKNPDRPDRMTAAR